MVTIASCNDDFSVLSLSVPLDGGTKILFTLYRKGESKINHFYPDWLGCQGIPKFKTANNNRQTCHDAFLGN
jgi:hypothetical protein